MSQEERELLTRSIELAEENNKILKSIRRGARISSAIRIIYWLIILGASFGAYYAIEPYIDSIIRIFENAKNMLGV